MQFVLDASVTCAWYLKNQAYLELARRLNLPIAGKNKPLLAAGAANSGVPVFAP